MTDMNNGKFRVLGLLSQQGNAPGALLHARYLTARQISEAEATAFLEEIDWLVRMWKAQELKDPSKPTETN